MLPFKQLINVEMCYFNQYKEISTSCISEEECILLAVALELSESNRTPKVFNILKDTNHLII